MAWHLPGKRPEYVRKPIDYEHKKSPDKTGLFTDFQKGIMLGFVLAYLYLKFKHHI